MSQGLVPSLSPIESCRQRYVTHPISLFLAASRCQNYADSISAPCNVRQNLISQAVHS